MPQYRHGQALPGIHGGNPGRLNPTTEAASFEAASFEPVSFGAASLEALFLESASFDAFSIEAASFAAFFFEAASFDAFLPGPGSPPISGNEVSCPSRTISGSLRTSSRERKSGMQTHRPPRTTGMQTHNMALKWVEPRQGRPRYRTAVDGRPFPGQTGPQHFSGPARKKCAECIWNQPRCPIILNTTLWIFSDSQHKTDKTKNAKCFGRR